MKKDIIIIGAGQFGILLSNILKRQNKFNILGFVDNDKKIKNKLINNFKVLGTDNYLFKNKKKVINLALAIGSIKKRALIIKKFKNKNFKFPSIVDKSCNIDEKSSIGKGSIICGGATILNNTKIGQFSIIGTNVNIFHHVKVGKNCVIGGATTIGSNVEIQNNVDVGVSAVFVSKKIKVKKNSIICSGSVVLSHVREGSKMIGNPAKPIPNKY